MLSSRDVRHNKTLLQNKKLKDRWEKYGDYVQFSIMDVYRHLVSEFKELAQAIYNKDCENAREEIADISNCLDFLWDLAYLLHIGEKR